MRPSLSPPRGFRRTAVPGLAIALACAGGAALFGASRCAWGADEAAGASGAASAERAASTAAASPARTPAALQGTWQVLHVAVDRAVATASHVPWEADDARFIGGLRVFDADGRVDPASPGCERLAWTAGTAAALSTLLARATGGAVRDTPSPADYGLHVGDPTLQPYTAACAAEGHRGAATPYDGGRWFALLSDIRLLASAGPGTVLVFERVTASSPMHAAIDCTQPSGDMEKTICGSHRLAGLDLAVAAAYRHALAAAHRQGMAAAGALRTSQADWRVSREACGKDAQCLALHMRSRIDALMAN